MTQELGRMERPSAGQFLGKRKLLLVPLVYGPPIESEEGLAILQRYWDQVQSQIASLESKLGELCHIYHESLTEGGPEGLKFLENVDQRSFSFVETKYQSGATLEATEDRETLLETLDLQRCLMVPLSSEKVAITLHEWLTESNRSRYEKIGAQIDATLGEDEVGLLMISERHQVQFAQDIEVFYVAPPALADFRRWLQDWAAQQQKASEEAGANE
jgi:hypothetical protein